MSITVDPAGDEPLQVQIVDRHGKPIEGDAPIDIGELLEEQTRMLKIKNRNVRVVLEEADEDMPEYDAATAERFAELDRQDAGATATTHLGGGDASVALEQVNDWYEQLEDAQEEINTQLSRGKSVELVREASGAPSSARGRESEAPAANAGRRKPRRHEKETEKLERVKEEWTSAAPPAPQPPRNFKVMKTVSIDSGKGSAAKFVPLSVAHHSACSYRVGANSERIVIFGGTNGHSEESEVYEFNVLTASWRRMEGKRDIHRGAHSHAAACDRSNSCMYVVGGVGPGGVPVNREALADPAAEDRFALMFPKQAAQGAQTSSGSPDASSLNAMKRSASANRSTASAGRVGTTAAQSSAINRDGIDRKLAARHELGILSDVYEFNLLTGTWLNFQPNHEMCVARHTTVCNNGLLYTFGGVDQNLEVQSKLVTMDTTNFACRMLRKTEDAPTARFSHTAVAYQNWMVVFGGADAQNECQEDAWSFDFEFEVWERMVCIGEAQPRAAHSACVVGSKMMVVGGVSVLGGEESRASNSVLELNLVPTSKGFVWREINCNPSIPALMYCTAMGCGDDATLQIFGGVTEINTKKKHKDTAEMSNAERSFMRSMERRKASSSRGGHRAPVEESSRALQVVNGCTLATFPHAPKKVQKDSDDEEEEDPYATGEKPLDPEFLAFLKRQRNFVLEKDMKEKKQQDQLSIEAQERADTNLFLTEDEIDALLKSCQLVIDTLKTYDMAGLPSNCPDRENKIKHMEESHFFVGQIRDVMRSMIKKELTEEELRKKKKTRRKEGEKFEDFSSAKPFRRALISSLMRKVIAHQKAIRKQNKYLGPFIWDAKEQYIEFTHRCKEVIDLLTEKISEILQGYINSRIDSLQKNAERHQVAMEHLRHYVEKIQHDKIFKKDGNDKHRVAREKKLLKDKAAEKQPATNTTAKKKRKSRSASPVNHPKPPPKEEDITVNLIKSDVEALQKRTLRAKAAVQTLATHCGAGDLSQPGGSQVQPTAPPAAAAAPEQPAQPAYGAATPGAGLNQQVSPVAAAQPQYQQVFNQQTQQYENVLVQPAAPVPAAEPPVQTWQEKSDIAKGEAVQLCQQMFDQLNSFETAVSTSKLDKGGCQVHSRDVAAVKSISNVCKDTEQKVLKIRMKNPKEDGHGPTIVDEESHNLANDVAIKVRGLFQRISNAFLTRTPMPRGVDAAQDLEKKNPGMSVVVGGGVLPKEKRKATPTRAPSATRKVKRAPSAGTAGAATPAATPAPAPAAAPTAATQPTPSDVAPAQTAQPVPAQAPPAATAEPASVPAATRVETPASAPGSRRGVAALPPSATVSRAPFAPSFSQRHAPVPEPVPAPAATQPPVNVSAIREGTAPIPLQQQQQAAALQPTLATAGVARPQVGPAVPAPGVQPVLPAAPATPPVVAPTPAPVAPAVPAQQQQPVQPVPSNAVSGGAIQAGLTTTGEPVNPWPAAQPPVVQPAPVQSAPIQPAPTVAQQLQQQQARHDQFHAAQRTATPIVAGNFGGGVSDRVYDEERYQRLYAGASQQTAVRGRTPQGSAGSSRTASASLTRRQAEERSLLNKAPKASPGAGFKGPLTPGERAILQSRQRNRQW